MVEHAACFIVETKCVVACETTLNPIRAVTDAYVVAVAIFFAYAIIVFDGVNNTFELGYIGISGTPVKCLQYAQSIFLDVWCRIWDDVVVYLRAFALGGFIVELNFSGIVLFPLFFSLSVRYFRALIAST